MKTSMSKLLQTFIFHKLKPPTACKFLLLITLFFLTNLSSSFAQTFPAGFSQVQVTNGLINPTVLAFAPDGRIFVAEQGGNLRIIKNGVLLPVPLVQLNVNASGERGLIGITLDPNFTTNKYIYLYYTVPTGIIHNRVSRFTLTGDVALASSEKIILELDPLSGATNHNGGAMQFGKDGKLYIAVGENANRANAQNLDTFHGKILRINADGSAPAGNPFTTGSEQRKRIWSYGLRNPYTFDFQPGTGRLFVNDVGEVTWEEINDATASGLNFGWPESEGLSNNTAHQNPVYTYRHGTGDGFGCAITGGVFFNPATSNYPASYTGKYFYQDLCNNWINFIDVSSSPAGRASFATGLPGQSLSLSVGNDGNLYYLSRNNSALYKIIYTTNIAPAITSQPGNLKVSAGQPATFRVSASGTAPLRFQWQKNSINIAGATGATYTISNTTAASAGQYRVIVTNPAGSVTSNAATLTVTTFNAAPTAKILSPVNHTLYRAGTVITFTGTGTDPEDGTLPASAFSWTVDFHHDAHKHDGPPVANNTKSGSFTIPNQGETATNVWYRLFLTVTDTKGLQHRDSIDLDPRIVTVQLATNPTGLQLNLNNQAIKTPFSQSYVAGMLIPLNAPSSQTLNGVAYQFTNWSSGTLTGGNMIVPDVNTTYKANFNASGITYLSDLTWTSAFNGWGPVEKDKSNGENSSVSDGKNLTLNGVTYNKGLGVHAASTLLYNLAGKYNRFMSDIGIDDEVGNKGSVNFQVYLDNVLAYESGNINGSSAIKPVNLNVSGKNQLKLVVLNGGDGNYFDHADWAGARLTVGASACTASGSILREYWANVKGYLISSIPVTTAPTATTQLTSFEAPANVADNYEQRIRGYICAPATGNYTFYIAGDDNTELWLSTNDNPVDKQKIAYSTSWTKAREWTKYATQKSAVITLQANTKYYLEALQKEGNREDHLSVGWMTPGSSSITVIPGSVLSPFTSTSSSAALSSSSKPDVDTDQNLSPGNIFRSYPNPFTEQVTLEFAFAQEEDYHLMIYNANGALVKTFKAGKAAANSLVQIQWMDEKTPAGLYLVRLVSKSNTQTLSIMRQ